MIHAYQEMYLNKVQEVLGDAFDYAVNSCNISGSEFINLFVTSTISKKMENGEPKFLVGKSGIELVIDILEDTQGIIVDIEPKQQYKRSTEYWMGWVIAYYQWFSGRKYREIFSVISFEDLSRMYVTLHEADNGKFVDIIDQRIKDYNKETNLKRIRNVYGITQEELAEKSGVSLRSIQMYEQKNKDINKANVSTVIRLAKVLGCEVESLLE